MRKLSTLALLVSAFSWCALAAPAALAADCAYDRAAMLAMDMQTFDQSPNGWRSVGETAGCELAAAELIAAYRTANATTLVNGEVDAIELLNWHEGQLRAVGGEIRPAIDRMNLAGMNAGSISDLANALYVQATAAFLARRRDALLAIREELAVVPAPSGFAEAAADFQRRTGRALSWPPNLDVVDGLIACFERPYREAYAGACRPASQ